MLISETTTLIPDSNSLKYDGKIYVLRWLLGVPKLYQNQIAVRIAKNLLAHQRKQWF